MVASTTLRNAMLLGLLVAWSADAPGTTEQDSASMTDSLAVPRALRLIKTHREQLDVPGMQLAVMRRGHLVCSEGIGYADLEQLVPTTPRTTFPIGSLSKTLTAAGAALLWQEGKLDFDAPIQRYVPAFPLKRWPISSRQLATNLSGIRHYADDSEAHCSTRYTSLQEALAIFRDDSLMVEPGTKSHYSSYAYVLLGAVIEGASGRDYSSFMRERLFAPLGMNATGPARSDSIVPWRARTYVEDESGRRIPAPFEDFSSKWPSGGLLSTAEDLARFGSALVTSRLFAPETVTMLWTEARTSDGHATGTAMGWDIRRDSHGRWLMVFDGNLPGSRALIAVHPDEALVVALIANTGKSVFLNAEEVLTLLELFVAPAPGPRRTEVPELAGSYEYDTLFDGEQVHGTLLLYRQQGDYRGIVTLPNGFFGSRVFPVPVVQTRGDEIELVAVLGNWLRMRMKFPVGSQPGRGSWRYGSMQGEVAAIRKVSAEAKPKH